MFGRVMGGRGRETRAGLFRPLKATDRQATFEIASAFDEDDGEALAETLEAGIGGFWVLEREGRVIGFTGFDAIPDSVGSAWLSWTYVAEDVRGRGAGHAMMDALKPELAAAGVERLFISTSDYHEDGEDVYAPARRFYEREGAREVLRVPDYYAPGETRILYLLGSGVPGQPAPPPLPDGEVSFVGFDAVDESETSRVLMWEVVAREEGEDVLDLMLADARAEGAARMFASLPEIQSQRAASRLRRAGFERVGALPDFYGAGRHEEHWGKALG